MHHHRRYLADLLAWLSARPVTRHQCRPVRLGRVA